jgi:hypothetical protein
MVLAAVWCTTIDGTVTTIAITAAVRPAEAADVDRFVARPQQAAGKWSCRLLRALWGCLSTLLVVV